MTDYLNFGDVIINTLDGLIEVIPKIAENLVPTVSLDTSSNVKIVNYARDVFDTYYELFAIYDSEVDIKFDVSPGALLSSLFDLINIIQDTLGFIIVPILLEYCYDTSDITLDFPTFLNNKVTAYVPGTLTISQTTYIALKKYTSKFKRPGKQMQLSSLMKSYADMVRRMSKFSGSMKTTGSIQLKYFKGSYILDFLTVTPSVSVDKDTTGNRACLTAAVNGVFTIDLQFVNNSVFMTTDAVNFAQVTVAIDGGNANALAASSNLFASGHIYTVTNTLTVKDFYLYFAMSDNTLTMAGLVTQAAHTNVGYSARFLASTIINEKIGNLPALLRDYDAYLMTHNKADVSYSQTMRDLINAGQVFNPDHLFSIYSPDLWLMLQDVIPAVTMNWNLMVDIWLKYCYVMVHDTRFMTSVSYIL